MLRFTMPELTLEGVKAFAKNLRKAGSRTAHETAGDLLADLLIFQSGILLPTETGLTVGLPAVSWIFGSTGSGKTELSTAITTLSMQHPKRRVIVVREAADKSSPYMINVLGLKQLSIAERSQPLSESYANVEITLPNPMLTAADWRPPENLVRFLEGALKDVERPTLIVLDGLDRWGQRSEHEISRILHLARTSPHDKAIIATAQNHHSRVASGFAVGATDGIIELSTGNHPKLERLVCPNDKSIKFSCPPVLITEDDRAILLRSYVRSSLSVYEALVRHLAEKISGMALPTTHTAALETTARLLGFSSWHSLQGFLSNRSQRPAKLEERALSPEQIIELMDRHGTVSNDMWNDRSIFLIEVVCAAGLDILSPSLLDDMIGKRGDPSVKEFLDTLPGYPYNRQKMNEQFGYLRMPINAALLKHREL